MKVYALPTQLPAPQIDFASFNFEKMRADEAAHQVALKAHMVSLGYAGERTGEVVRFHVADGYAQYMFADAGAKSILVHLPYGDAYSYPDVGFLPRKEVLRRLDSQKKFDQVVAARAI